MELIGKLQVRLQEKAVLKTKNWWEKYLKYEINFRGVKMADIRTAVHGWYQEEAIGERFAANEQLSLACELIREPIAEDKLAGILFLQEILLPAEMIDWQTDLPKFADFFERGYIRDWNTCDWFCVRVLGPLADQQGEPCARTIAAWKDTPTLWQRRAAGVAFVNLAKRGDEFFQGFVDMLLEVCSATVKSPERFAQTGTGWTLRELSYVEPDRVVEFIRENEPFFSKDGWKYVTGKMPEVVVGEIMGLRK